MTLVSTRGVSEERITQSFLTEAENKASAVLVCSSAATAPGLALVTDSTELFSRDPRNLEAKVTK